ncbi:TetR/AcrR family transcriptional regulator C-terminal domain-containing protein [Actinocrispum sp. NPDC049592]|uniref:TetR/AcrR family transcriptional regulator C-terminal domain-containing protein n=1 Tax=Actinocrispum sp. NPDC049592 TaxID=3154835 RepID=UPI00341F14B9
MKLTRDGIARAALDLLAEHGLDGLTMRLVAKHFDVQASALYWHVKSKRELLDAMAEVILVAASSEVEAPRQGVTWEDWTIERASRLHAEMLRYRDGAKVVAGTNTAHPALFRLIELSLGAMLDAGFPLDYAARSYPVIYHFTIGYTIEEQARLGGEYATNPYEREAMAAAVDSTRFPLTASVLPDLFGDAGQNFEHGLRIVLAGIRSGVSSGHSAAPGDT